MLEQIALRNGTKSVTQTMHALFTEFAGLPMPSMTQDADYYNYDASRSGVENSGGQSGYFPSVVSTQAQQQDIENLRSRLASSDQTVQAQMQQIMYLEEQLTARQQQQQQQQQWQKPQQHYLQYPATIFPTYYGYNGSNNNNGSSNWWLPQQQSYQQQTTSPYGHYPMMTPSTPAFREEHEDLFTQLAKESLSMYNWLRVMRGIGFL